MEKILLLPAIQSTYDYDKFVRLEGNRALTNHRKNKIIESIKKVGYVPSPIIVNEKFEIIDGQGRVEALKEMKLPVYYIQYPGLTIKHCIAMNITLTNWSLMDFIKSYAEQGCDDYKNFLHCIENHKALTYDVVSLVCAGNSRGFDSSRVKDGTLSFRRDAVKDAEEYLWFIETYLLPLKDKINGRFSCLVAAVVFALKHTDADKNRIVKTLQTNIYNLSAIANTDTALKELERIYNYRLSNGKMYFVAEYDKWVTEINRISLKAYRQRVQAE